MQGDACLASEVKNYQCPGKQRLRNKGAQRANKQGDINLETA
jgi:hypothetical protein